MSSYGQERPIYAYICVNRAKKYSVMVGQALLSCWWVRPRCAKIKDESEMGPSTKYPVTPTLTRKKKGNAVPAVLRKD